jgi:hypothetical protein
MSVWASVLIDFSKPEDFHLQNNFRGEATRNPDFGSRYNKSFRFLQNGRFFIKKNFQVNFEDYRDPSWGVVTFFGFATESLFKKNSSEL